MNEISHEELPEVLKKGPVLIDFYADWCQPCRALKPVLQELSAENDGIQFVMMDIEKAPPLLATTYKIAALPTLVLLDGDREEKLVGLHSKKAIQQCIDSFLSK